MKKIVRDWIPERGERRRSTPEEDRPLVLICGPTPPPFGGIASIVSLLRDADFNGFRYQIVDTTVKSYNRAARILYGLLTARRVTAAVIRHRPAAMLSFSSAYGSFWEKALWSLVGQLFGVRTAVMLVDGKFPMFEQSLSVTKRRALRAMLNRYSLVGVQSQSWLQYYTGLSPHARYQIITGGVNASVFSPPSERVDRDPPTLLFVGWLIRNKGIYDLIDAAARLARAGRAFHLRFVGPTFGRESEIQKAIDEAGITDQAQLVGLLPSHEALISEYRHADVFILPTHYEGFPTVVLEAMASGLAVVSTEVGAIPEIVEHSRSGILVPPQDAGALAQAIGDMLDDANLRREMGMAARARVLGRFTVAHSLSSYQAFFHTLLQLPEPVIEATK